MPFDVELHELFIYFGPTFSFFMWGPSCSTWGLHCFMLNLFMWHMWLVVAWGLSACGTGLSCSAACGVLVPRLRIEPTSPPLQGRFLTTGPSGKSLFVYFGDYSFASLLASIFSHSEGYLFLFVVSFTVQKLVNLIRSHLLIFVFIFITV